MGGPGRVGITSFERRASLYQRKGLLLDVFEFVSNLLQGCVCVCERERKPDSACSVLAEAVVVRLAVGEVCCAFWKVQGQQNLICH